MPERAQGWAPGTAGADRAPRAHRLGAAGPRPPRLESHVAAPPTSTRPSAAPSPRVPESSPRRGCMSTWSLVWPY